MVSAFVLIKKEDVSRISDHLSISESEFSSKYNLTGNLLDITKGQCPFLDNENRCSIHSVKPAFCAEHNCEDLGLWPDEKKTKTQI